MLFQAFRKMRRCFLNKPCSLTILLIRIESFGKLAARIRISIRQRFDDPINAICEHLFDISQRSHAIVKFEIAQRFPITFASFIVEKAGDIIGKFYRSRFWGRVLSDLTNEVTRWLLAGRSVDNNSYFIFFAGLADAGKDFREALSRMMRL